MPRHRNGLFSAAIGFVLALGILSPIRAHGQAVPAAQRAVGFSAYGGYQWVKPDYGPDSDNNNGAMFGVDATRYLSSRHFELAASLELRANLNYGPTVNEKTYLGGAKVEKQYGRYHPYGTFLAGLGTIHYNVFPQFVGARGDNGVVLSYGPGVDIDLTRSFALKAEYDFTQWSLGGGTSNNVVRGNYNPDTLTPGVLNVGIKYNFPFESLYTRRHRR